ncbi:DUF3592 domain-containing protein [Kineosporia sp. R_H_3]|uniref:DUF3592 domain-containing protein n=1 Tax=Kineosporia sp. R_H_3 TaxID=1961848 RepID=UPI000B4B30F5|nr:DUF3592 domain-containing protein [Kineosporia sp. R_H_3]
MTVLWVLFGAGWLVSGTSILVREGRLLHRRRGCRPAVGQVLAVRKDRSTGQWLFRPTVSVLDAHGATVTVETLNPSHRPDMAPGDFVNLLVDPINGTAVQLADRTVQIINMALGAAAVMIGAGMLAVVTVWGLRR